MLAGLRERGVDALLLLVGDGDDRERLEQRAHDLGLARSCLFLGYQEDVAPWYAVCDAVVLTSASEGTPVTIIEALAAGRPSSRPRSAACPTSSTRARRASSCDRATPTRSPSGSRSWPATRSAARRWARQDASMLSRYAVERLVSDVDALYRELLDGVRHEPPVAAERDILIGLALHPGTAAPPCLRASAALDDVADDAREAPAVGRDDEAAADVLHDPHRLAVGVGRHAQVGRRRARRTAGSAPERPRARPT